MTNSFDSSYKFNLFKKYDVALNYALQKYQEYDLDVSLESSNLLNSTIEKTYGTQVGFNYKICRFTTRYDLKTRNENLLNTDDEWTKEHALSLKANFDFKAEKGLKIPLIKKRFIVENRVKLDTELKGTQKRGNILEDNKNTYSILVNNEYNFTSHFQSTIGAEYRVVEFTESKESGYDVIVARIGVSLIF